MEDKEAQGDHGKFEELCALAQAGALGIEERLDLEQHLRKCERCRGIRKIYAEIGQAGMAFLVANEPLAQEAERWDNRAARQRLLSAVQDQTPRKVVSMKAGSPRQSKGPANRGWTIASLAACLAIMAVLGAYRLGERQDAASQAQSPVATSVQHGASTEEQPSAGLLASQAAQISRLQQQVLTYQQEISRLRSATTSAEDQFKGLGTMYAEEEAANRQLAEERDKLARRLDEEESAYHALQADFVNLKAEHSRTLLRAASLESDMTKMTSATRDQERRLKDNEQYLTADRDIRELMGARKLYIADVFDVDSVSHTRKPFGRVFYTQNKSLVFYAFDLDHQPGIKNANVFQVWGQRDSDPNRDSHPMNLGILYMDSESNRRWVLRSDDPKQLAEIDAVFVTVEPQGGSQKPTGKPLLYALLRKEANHP